MSEIFVIHMGESKFQDRLRKQLSEYSANLRQPHRGLLDAFAEEVVVSEREGDLSPELFNRMGMILLMLMGRVEELEASNQRLMALFADSDTSKQDD